MQFKKRSGQKKPAKRRITVGFVALAAAVAGIYLLISLQTYSQVRVTEIYKNKGAVNNSYEEFAGGVLKYSRDGVSYLNQKGEERWNHSKSFYRGWERIGCSCRQRREQYSGYPKGRGER